MELIWKIDDDEIARLREFVAQQSTNAFVRYRIKNNVEEPPATTTLDHFWEVMVGCILTSQQRSGPDSPVTRLLSERPFPLSFAAYSTWAGPEAEGQRILKEHGGIRFTNRIPQQLARNFAKFQTNLWAETRNVLETVRTKASPEAEREAAEFIAVHYDGFGSKQARNLLQSLGHTKYEIPIDSRIIKWLNHFGFPVALSAYSLGDPYYYNFVSDGIQAMCRQSGIIPCVLDAAIFSSFDGDGWTDENVEW